jgi:lysozyme
MAKHRRMKRRPAVRARAMDTVEFTRGIDVSHHQGKIDWARVAASGIKYAFMKATQGAGFIDSRFAANWAGAAINHVVRGAYHFFDPGAPAARQFENFRNVVALEPGDLAPVLDLELDGQDWTDLPSAQRIPVVIELLERLEDHYAMIPLIYTSRGNVDAIFRGQPGPLTHYPLWVASYRQNPPPTMPAGWTDWTHWQHSSQGTVPGITGAVDLNRCIGDPGPVLPEPEVLVRARRSSSKARRRRRSKR